MKVIGNKKIYVIIILIVLIIIGIFVIVKVNKNKEEKEEIEQLTQFDITVVSYLDLMPNPMSDDYGKKEAYFSFLFDGIDIYDFENEYEIESIKLNGKLINNSDIIFLEDYGSFRIYSTKYKNNSNNKIELIIKNKNTNIKYLKKLEVKTISVY
jgi:hypothetical protein